MAERRKPGSSPDELTGVQLLAHGLSLQTVAHELGYESASAFAVMFKKQTGKPPGRFAAERQPRAASRQGPAPRL